MVIVHELGNSPLVRRGVRPIFRIQVDSKSSNIGRKMRQTPTRVHSVSSDCFVQIQENSCHAGPGRQFCRVELCLRLKRSHCH